MGVSLNHVTSAQRPLSHVSEQVLIIPTGKHLDVGTVGSPKILYCLGGAGSLSLKEGVRVTIVPGDTVILRNLPRQRYFPLHSKGPARLHMLIIFYEQRHRGRSGASRPGDDDALEDYLESTFSEDRHLASRGSYILWELASRIREECESRQLFSDLFVCELAKQFTFRLAEYAGLHPSIRLPGSLALVQKACDGAMQFLSAGKSASQEEMTGSMGVSRATLCRNFREWMGVPYARFMDRMAIERAKLLLLDSHLAVSDIARMAHFSSAGTFSRAFKATTGLTPRGYRNSYDGTPVTWSGRAERGPELPRHQLGPELRNERYKIVHFPGVHRLEEAALIIGLAGRCAVTVGNVEMALHETDGKALLVGGGKKVVGRPQKIGETASALVLPALLPLPLNGGGVARSSQEGLAELLQKNAVLPLQLPSPRDLTLLRSWIRAKATDAHPAHARQMVRSLSRTIRIQALRGVLEPGRKPRPALPVVPAHRLLLSHARDFMRKHSDQPLTLDQIAWAVGVSGEHLARVFRAETGETVMTQLQAIRISKAQSELVKTDRSLSEISESLGFSTVPLFFRVFKRHAGCTPSAFRRKGIGALR